MQPGAAAGGVQQEAGGGVGVVGDAGAVVEGEGRGGGECGVVCSVAAASLSRVSTTVKPRASRRERRRKARASVTFFSRVLSPMRAPAVGAAVAGVEHDHVAVEAVDGVGRVLGGGFWRFAADSRRGGQGMCRGCSDVAGVAEGSAG